MPAAGPLFDKAARAVTQWAGSLPAFALAFAAVLLWAVLGALFFGFGTDYQMWINTGTTIVTFLMVFVIQRSQNRDTQALQTKLDALIAAGPVRNSFMAIEELSQEDFERLHERLRRLALKARQEDSE